MQPCTRQLQFWLILAPRCQNNQTNTTILIWRSNESTSPDIPFEKRRLPSGRKWAVWRSSFFIPLFPRISPCYIWWWAFWCYISCCYISWWAFWCYICWFAFCGHIWARLGLGVQCVYSLCTTQASTAGSILPNCPGTLFSSSNILRILFRSCLLQYKPTSVDHLSAVG